MTLDIQEILDYLPHRYPFLLIDRVVEFERAKRLVAIKNVTINEPFFQGHFPGCPIMPGVLVVEAMAQAGGILMMSEFLTGTPSWWSLPASSAPSFAARSLRATSCASRSTCSPSAPAPAACRAER